ncbi:EAL and HDOD domain-containing protein [Thiosulfativibrio zosterae]|uniref:Diguanylate phosphodiesterase n=1 Tax=Thiosulfativibrio zosterae TaxID=2675053 RepID=A0A6F8PKL6_9GAMM|nr:EAL domain-containing protein [Thiosulfativibrio zosterae]BBP42540.1 hypothetical protein THMIRHAT_02860 [Thiosulfativibrio zosterae]
MTNTADENIFIGRQPIFLANRELFGYELLFRNGFTPNAAVPMASGSEATATVINNAMMHFGLENIVGDGKAFINFPESFFTDQITPCFSPKNTIIEVLEDVSPTETVITALKALKQQGYTIALDDFVFRKKLIPFIQLADIIKFDVQYVKIENIAELFRRVKKVSEFKIVAERVETTEMFDACRDAGADYFQGYFFAKPEVIQGTKMSVGRQNLMLLLQKITDDAMHLEDLERIVERDIGLVHKIMKLAEQYRNRDMPMFETLKEVMMLFGLKRVQSWATLLSMSAVDDVMPEVFGIARVRAIFMRSVAEKMGLKQVDSFYLTGLFSVLDVVLKKTLQDAITDLPVNDLIKNALLKGEGEQGQLLKLAQTFEGNAKSSAAQQTQYAGLYLAAVEESNQMARVL